MVLSDALIEEIFQTLIKLQYISVLQLPIVQLAGKMQAEVQLAGKIQADVAPQQQAPEEKIPADIAVR